MNNLTVLLIGIVLLAILLAITYLMRKYEVKTFLHDGISIDETKVSIVVIMFIAWNFVGMYLVLARDIFPDPVMFIILGLGGGIVGENIGNSNIQRKATTNYTQQPQPPPSTVQQPTHYDNSDLSDLSDSGK